MVFDLGQAIAGIGQNWQGAIQQRKQREMQEKQQILENVLKQDQLAVSQQNAARDQEQQAFDQQMKLAGNFGGQQLPTDQANSIFTNPAIRQLAVKPLMRPEHLGSTAIGGFAGPAGAPAQLADAGNIEQTDIAPGELQDTGQSTIQQPESENYRVAMAQQAGLAERGAANQENQRVLAGIRGDNALALADIRTKSAESIAQDRIDAANARAAGAGQKPRGVTSGDAGRIADIDTSLDDIGALRSALTETKGATGTAAKMGAMLPNAVTEFTGWGTNPKKRQAVIDRVKQVIGKTLEGGVLRKEDEIKYEKILPTLGDTAEVAMGKLNGLEAALTQRRSTFLDALTDAGYTTDKFMARKRGASTPATDPAAAPAPASGAAKKPGRFSIVSVQ